jgi:hypothetical protein
MAGMIDMRRIPIEAGRVVCPLLGEAPLDRCRECAHLIRIDYTRASTAHRVVCIDRGWDDGDNLAW